MVTGTVSLSLADVDKMRQDIANAQAAQKKAEAELAEVKADRRTVLIERIKPLTERCLRVTLPEWNVGELGKAVSSARHHLNDFCIISHNRYKSNGIDITRYVDVDLHEDKVQEKVSYINFGDVEQQIRKKLEQDVADEVAKLKAEAKHHTEKLADAEEKWQRENIDLQKEYEKQKQKFKEQIEEWVKKYNELETGKKEQTRIEELLEQIKKLEEQLNKEKAKRWYQKF
jgi:flagellar capping protein FliD